MEKNYNAIYQALSDVVGEEFISDDKAICQAYSKDASLSSCTRKHKKDFSTVPKYVVLPSSTEDVQGCFKNMQQA